MTTSTTPKRYAVKTGSNESIQNTRDAIRAMEPFKTSGSLYGERGNHGLPWGSRLSPAETDEWTRVANQILYVVFSYGTPIAWAYAVDRKTRQVQHKPGQRIAWHVVSQKFSMTTTSHQSQVTSALAGLRRTTKDGPLQSYNDPEWASQYHDEPIEYEGL